MIVAAGAWVSKLLPSELCECIKIYRQILCWYQPAIEMSEFFPERFPTFIRTDQNEEGVFYGFPAIDGANGGIKVPKEDYRYTCTPETINRDVSPEELNELHEKLKRYIKISDKTIHATTCLYTVTPDYDFIIDRLPEYPQVIVASPCSGHGFKHSAGIGEVLSEMVAGRSSSIGIEPFSISRFCIFLMRCACRYQRRRSSRRSR